MQRPIGGHVGRRTVDQDGAAGGGDVDPPKRRGERISRRLAHRLLARPQAQECPPALVRGHWSQAFAFARGEEFTRQAIGVDDPVAVLDVDADPQLRRERRCDADQRHAPRVRHVEVERLLQVQFGAAAQPAPQRNFGRRDAKRTSQEPAQRRAPDDPARPQEVRAKASRARMLGLRQAMREIRDVAGGAVERRPPQIDSCVDRRQRHDMTGGSQPGKIARLREVVYAHAVFHDLPAHKRLSAVRNTAPTPCDSCSSSSPGCRCPFSMN